MPSDLACPTRPVWQYRTAPALSALLPTLPGVSRIGLRSAPTGLLRQPGEEDSHLLRYTAPHGAQAPHGALPAHRDHDHLGREAEPGERRAGRRPRTRPSRG